MEDLNMTYNGEFTPEERKMMTAQSLRDLRKERKLSQKEVAAYLNIPASTYNTYESGRTEPPLEMLVRLSHRYGISIDLIVQRDRTFSTAEDAIKQLEQYKAQLGEIDQIIAKGGENTQYLSALRNTLDVMVDAMLDYSQKPEVQKAINETAKKGV